MLSTPRSPGITLLCEAPKMVERPKKSAPKAKAVERMKEKAAKAAAAAEAETSAE